MKDSRKKYPGYYKVKPVLVKEMWCIAHKGKSRGFSYRLGVHFPNEHEIIYVDYGRVVLRLNGTELYINPGECIFIPGGAAHSFFGDKGAPFDYLNIMFSGKLPESLFGRTLTMNMRCIELMEKLKQESCHEAPYFQEIMTSVLTELISRLLRQVELSIPEKFPEFTTNHQRHCSDIVNRALKIIADEYSKPLNIRQLSRAAGIGGSRLRQLFKIETGENFTTILHKQRMVAAKHLINEKSFSLEEISSAVGYRYPSFFFKIFKRITGMTPKEFSRSLGEPTVKE